MVEMLGEKKMALEERVTELEEAVADLEALQVLYQSTNRKINYRKNIYSTNNPNFLLSIFLLHTGHV